MIVTSLYQGELTKYSSRPISSSNVNLYYKNLGLHFELTINKEMMKLREFFLYWKLPVTITEPMVWSLGGSFINDKSILMTKEERSKFLIDHLVVTPYAAIVLEANDYAVRNYQISGDDWNYMNDDGFYKRLPNPLSKLRLNVALMQQILSYCGVSLPVLGKVVLMNKLNIGFVKGNASEFVHINDLKFSVEEVAAEAPRDRTEALKLVKIFEQNGCFPIAYDGNVSNWSK